MQVSSSERVRLLSSFDTGPSLEVSPSACEVCHQDDSSAIFCLEQNPDFNGEWTLAGGVLPTLTRVNTHMYNPSEERWLTGGEKMNAMGFPVFDETADAAGVPRVNVSDIQGSVHKAAGNSMAIGLFALLQIAIYSCIEFESATPSAVPVPAVLAEKLPKGIVFSQEASALQGDEYVLRHV